MTNEKVTITTSTTKEELINYIGYPCIKNWKNLAKKEQDGTPVKKGVSVENACSGVFSNSIW